VTVASSARIAWFATAGTQTARDRPTPPQLLPPPEEVRANRVDNDHSNIVRTWGILGKPEWPDADGWARLRAENRPEVLEAPRVVAPDGGSIELAFDLPMPAMSLIELVPY
jgi:hypothetical protein